MIEFNVVLAAVVPVFLITGAGFVLRRLGWLTEEADHSLLRLTINLLLPCLLLDSALGNPALSEWRNLLLAPAVRRRTVGWNSQLRGSSRFRPMDDERRGDVHGVAALQYGFVQSRACFFSVTHRRLLLFKPGVELALTACVLVLERTRARRDGAVDQRAVGLRWCGVGVEFLWRRESHPRGCPQDD